jgi:hypothetical protein
MTTLTAQDVERLAAFCAKHDIVEIGAKTLAKLCSIALRGMEREGEVVVDECELSRLYDAAYHHEYTEKGSSAAVAQQAAIGAVLAAHRGIYTRTPAPSAVSTEAVTFDEWFDAEHPITEITNQSLRYAHKEISRVAWEAALSAAPGVSEPKVICLECSELVPESLADTHCAEGHGGKA